MTPRAGGPPTRALLGTILFVTVVPGTVIGLVPYWITGWQPAGSTVMRILGALLFIAATPLFFSFVSRFVWEGRGTPAPIAPTERLVVGGPFRWVRNPGYVAVVAMLVGQALFFASPQALLYAGSVALAFHVFVLVYEEPTLRATFGEEYQDYCRRVPRWLPRPPGR